MLRARAPVGQDLGPRLLDGHEAFALQALEHRERRRQQFTALAVVPTPARDRRLDGGNQERGRCLSVTRLHCHARSLCRRRRDVGHFRRAPRTPVRAGGDQPERRANVRPADCLRQHPQGATYSKIAAAMACRVTRWADRSKSRSGQGRARPALCLNLCLSDQRCS
jgi:hypothetical protein